MATPKKEKQLFSAMITVEDSKKFKEIAASKQLTQSGVLREWIARSHRALEANKDKSAA